MWYSKDAKSELDYSRPIVAEGPGVLSLLMPQISKDDGYSVVGYNWFKLNEGAYQSCRFWDTPEEAVKAYTGSYTIKNVTLTVE